jgi:spore coat assembly protein SafA
MTEAFEDDAPQPRRSNGARPTFTGDSTQCWVISRVDGLRIRDRASTDSEVNGRLAAGESIPASCRAQRGERYSDCGGSQWWVPVPQRGRTDYVAWACVDWFTSDPEPEPEPGGRTYTVQRGDTLNNIARRFGVSLANLLRANPQITDPDRIFPGQVINIPRG